MRMPSLMHNRLGEQHRPAHDKEQIVDTFGFQAFRHDFRAGQFRHRGSPLQDNFPSLVIPGLAGDVRFMDCRVKPGHDGCGGLGNYRYRNAESKTAAEARRRFA